MRLVCISAAHTPYNGELMEKSAQRVGVEIVRFKEGEPWPNDFRVGKLVHGLECIRQLPNDVTHVMFVDSSDTLFLAGPEEIVAKFEKMRNSVSRAIVSGEKNCYPIAELAKEYPEPFPPTPWHFVNSGSWIMRRKDAEELLEIIAGKADYCDQLCWTKAHLDIPAVVGVDLGCSLFQSMYLQTNTEFELADGRLTNLVTGLRPCVLHWNGTHNQGVPFSRDGVWCALDPSHEPDAPKAPTARRLCVCMPGSSFSAIWMMEWAGLLLHLVGKFHLRLAGGEGNNIYLVRENCLKQALGDPNGLPDLILWIDSDNPPTVQGFEMLLAAVDASQEVSMVGGWYRFHNPFTKDVYIAAGKRHKNVTEAEVLEARSLIEVDFIGFGFCLMRRQVIDDIGLDKCFEPVIYSQNPITAPEWKEGMRTWSTDDDGFGIRAQEAGHKIFLHPGVFAHHEKRLNVPGSFVERNEDPILKES